MSAKSLLRSKYVTLFKTVCLIFIMNYRGEVASHGYRLRNLLCAFYFHCVIFASSNEIGHAILPKYKATVNIKAIFEKRTSGNYLNQWVLLLRIKSES